MKRIPLVVPLLFVAAGCGNKAPGAAPAPSPPAAPGGGSPTAGDLSGTWITGEADEPSPGPVVRCHATKLWNLSHTATQVTGEMDFCVGPCAATQEHVTGTAEGGVVVLKGELVANPEAQPEPVEYQLEYDANSKHLRGTRNGQSFWAAPFAMKTDESCGPRPL